ncbi:MAG TPA: D-alanyl-D-alanine carboxypeptidase, partial [Planctomycetota bacterium]|nr:D-alanyl-D-alanine carboxypeptidase [Planctomycetota bacterium]
MRWVLVVAALLCAAPGLSAQERELEQAIAQAEALGAVTGVAVADVDSKTMLWHRRAGEAFTPASNMKLLTAAAVLRGLGSDYQFSTRFQL